MAKVIKWEPGNPIISFNPNAYRGVREIHWHETSGGNMRVKMTFADGNHVFGDVDKYTQLAELERLFDWMYRKGEQAGFVNMPGKPPSDVSPRPPPASYSGG